MRSRRGTRPLCLLVLGPILAACGGTIATPTPTTAPPPATPSPTPDPHLAEPVSALAIVAQLQGTLPIVTNTGLSIPDQEPRQLVRGTLGGWPIEVLEYSSAEALHAAGFQPDQVVSGERVYRIAGENILVAFGPLIGSADEPRPAAIRRAQAMTIVEILAPLIGPLGQSTTDPLPIPTPANAEPVSPAGSPAASP